MASLRVLGFTGAAFLSELTHGGCTPADVEANLRATYLSAYLSAIGAATIVSEDDYVDADYLDDYANFYAKSFEPIPNRCRRLHFFRNTFDKRQFVSILLNPLLQQEHVDGYLGFVVARPLPTAIIGRTILKTYPSDGGRRHYPAVRRYCVSLFGIRLSVDSLAFQEQDTSLAACATVALWSCFQKAQDLFHSAAPTPAAITRAANKLLLAARPFPSRGLQIQQVCNAIAAVGLDPEVYQVTPDLPLVSLIYSYVKLGLPVLVVVTIGNEGHAIAINGFSLRQTRQLSSEGAHVDKLLPPLIGSRIDELYGHDDQRGPFCRLKLVAPIGPSDVVTFTDTGWPVDLVPIAIVVPVYPKIRTGFREVKSWLPKVSVIASWVAKPEELEWDVHLTTSNDFKDAIRNGGISVSSPLREELLLTGFPKYLWRCSLQIKGTTSFEMLLDTTAMVKGFPIKRLWWADRAIGDQIRPFANLPVLKADLIKVLGLRLYDMLTQA